MPIRCAARYGESGDGARECYRGVRGAAEGHPLHSSLPGIRLPEVAVLVGTHAGWDPRDPATGAPEQIVPMNGLTLFPMPGRASALATRGPRLPVRTTIPRRFAPQPRPWSPNGN